ncbi:MAG TPA: nickel pincer cofactor biosynthesis protein LarC [Pseudonocardia sp.]|nr:nickel pincer cofactor biosynthesis protein LarC [Pseudonocardia sp.]
MILWLNPVTGISGDMLLGALLGLGAPVERVRETVTEVLGGSGWSLERVDVTRGALRATHAPVRVDEPDVPARPARELLALVGRANPEPVAALATRAVRALAEVEADLHGVPVDQVHLHELGGMDTVIDTVGVAAALHALDISRVHCGPIALGSGTVATRHGVLPVPAPATAALLARAGASAASTDVRGELATPTGVALLLAAGAVFGPVPAMAVRAVAYGAGTRELPDRPNVLQALLGAPDAGVGVGVGGATELMVQVETNVDDVTGEVLGYLVGRLLDEGAADAWISAVTMKKGRPAHTVHVLVRPDRADRCEDVLLRETGSLGVRRRWLERRVLPRRQSEVVLEGRRIGIKHGPWGSKPEYEDVRRAADALGLPLREVAERARRLADDAPNP